MANKRGGGGGVIACRLQRTEWGLKTKTKQSKNKWTMEEVYCNVGGEIKSTEDIEWEQEPKNEELAENGNGKRGV